MKLNKTFGRIATTLVATAMLASMAVVPAFAEDGSPQGIQNGANNALTFRKELVMPENVPVPAVSFDFSLTGTDFNETVDDGTHQITTTAGTGDATTTSVDFSSAYTEDTTYEVSGLDKYYKDVSISLPETDFDKPGIYTYILHETNNDASSENKLSAADFTLSDDYKVYVYVTGLNDPQVTGVVIMNDTNSDSTVSSVDSDAKTAVITNYYLATSTGPKDNTVTVAKKVTGDMGDISQDFRFSVTAGSADTGKTYTLQKFNKNNAPVGTAIPLTAGVANDSITLKDGEYIVISGLGNNDYYCVDEMDAFADNYITSIDNNRDNTADVTDEDEVKEGLSGNFTTAVNAQFINNRDAVSPTGLIMDIAPYVLLVVVAAAGCFVFLRKRRED